MCIITVLPPRVRLSREQITDALENNPHGVGVMYSYRGRLNVAYSMSRDPRRLLSWMNAMPRATTRIVHFRKQTAGVISRDNLHPFVIHERFGLMHNGTLAHSIAPRKKDEPRSDTRIFSDDLLASMPPDTLVKPALWKLIDAAGEDNRIVMLDGETGQLYFTAEHLWEYGYEDIQLSNTYSIQNGRLWGVRKTTFAEFHGYSTVWSPPTKVSAPAPAPASAPSPSVSPWNQPFDGFKPPAPPASTVLTPAPRTDLEVLNSAYCLCNNGVQVPLAFATSHDLYAKAREMLPKVDMQDFPLSYSTIVLAILHARLSQEEIDRITPDRVELLIRQLITFVKDTPHSAATALIAHYKENANVN